MAGRKLSLDPRRTTTRQGEITTRPSWAAIAAAFLFLMAFIFSGLTSAGLMDYNPGTALYVGVLSLGSITFAILSLGDDR